MSQGLRDQIQNSLGLNENQLNKIIVRSPHTYKVYTIPKKSGGVREIAQPAKETKFVQHWIIENVFKNLPIHECASAYKANASIKANADAHKINPYIAKFDFSSFFTSIREIDLINHLARHLGNSLTAREIADIARISCIKHKGAQHRCLSIGAPSSPILSNTVMYEFDCEVAQWRAEKDIAYTRYADDITFSTSHKNLCIEIEPKIRQVIRIMEYPKLLINSKKTTHVSKKNQRRITGVIINNEGELSLGREKKRRISSLIHRFSLGQVPEDEIYNLQGLLGFAKDIEPLFISRMSAKYGAALLNEIFRKRK